MNTVRPKIIYVLHKVIDFQEKNNIQFICLHFDEKAIQFCCPLDQQSNFCSFAMQRNSMHRPEFKYFYIEIMCCCCCSTFWRYFHRPSLSKTQLIILYCEKWQIYCNIVIACLILYSLEMDSCNYFNWKDGGLFSWIKLV